MDSLAANDGWIGKYNKLRHSLVLTERCFLFIGANMVSAKNKCGAQNPLGQEV